MNHLLADDSREMSSLIYPKFSKDIQNLSPTVVMIGAFKDPWFLSLLLRYNNLHVVFIVINLKEMFSNRSTVSIVRKRLFSSFLLYFKVSMDFSQEKTVLFTKHKQNLVFSHVEKQNSIEH